MNTLNKLDELQAEASKVRVDLAVVLESLTRLEERDKPILISRYLATLGELEYQLMTLQVEGLGLQWRIENIQASLNRGEAVTPEALSLAEDSISLQLSAWTNSLTEKESAISNARQMMIDMIVVPAETVQQVKSSYRRLARLLHPDVSPQHKELFNQYWNSIQQAYLSMDASLLEAILHVVEHEVLTESESITKEEVERLKAVLLEQTQRLAQLQSSTPYIYAELLNNETWVATKRSELMASIEQAAERQAQLLSHYLAIKSKVLEC